jgi:hypothetical protein
MEGNKNTETTPPPPQVKEKSIVIAQGELTSPSDTTITETTPSPQVEERRITRELVLATSPLPTSWGEGAPPDTDKADKAERPAAETETTGAQSA